jgi:dTDP-3-amino-3,4,6-trideoxy-alpha-D-glucose transaminase
VTTNSSLRLEEHDRNRVRFLDLGACYRELKDECDAVYQRVMASGWYILGQELEAFEEEFAAYCGLGSCVGVGNGLEALSLILRAYGIGQGDEVIVPANTFIATWLAASHTGARPIPVEPLPDTCNLDPGRVEAAVTRCTRAIIAVHLYGQPADMDAIRHIASKRGLRVIEDAAQAHGATWNGRRAGALADAAAFSFYPAKNLGAFGDGGAVVSDDRALIDRIRTLRNYGSLRKHQHDVRGYNSRLDPLQAAFLRVRLMHLDEWNARRREVARAYLGGLAGAAQCVLPAVAARAEPSWHLFVIRHATRDRLRRYLDSKGIETALHYPVPPHLSPAYADLGFRRGDLPVTELLADTVVSLPLSPHIGRPEVDRVIRAILDFEAAGE